MFFTGVTDAGQPGNPNEDWVSVTSDLVVVLDGATVRTDTGCLHGVAWYTRHLGMAILAAASDHTLPLRSMLAAAIDHVAGLHPECDLAHPGTPSAAVAIVRIDVDAVRYAVLGDATVVLESTAGIATVSDDRISRTAALERAAVDKHPIGSPEKRDAMVAMKHAELAARNKPDGYWIAAADPAAAAHALEGEVPLEEVRRMAVMTDGAARIVDMFHLGDWLHVLDLLGHRGPGALIHRVRKAEADDPDGEFYRRNKTSDDATVVYAAAGVCAAPRSRVEARGAADMPALEMFELVNSGRLYGSCPTVDGRYFGGRR
ncbi:MAG TPA: hypothetical protein VHX38_02735 [Pseudonocardiaceae bacterium]|nr:hypothetical protein [Pseudonocardiaceae bacterium]